MSIRIELEIHLAKDEESGLWYIAQSELPGLRLEADTAADLIRAIEDVAPDLIELNHDEISTACAHKPGWSGNTAPTFALRPVIDTALVVA